MLAPQKEKMAYYMPESAYLILAPAMMLVPPPKTVKLPQPPQQWTGHKTQQGYHPGKRQRKRGSGGNYRGNHQQQSWGKSSNPHYQHLTGNQSGHPGGANTAYYNTHKRFPMLEYCYSCSYDVDHNGLQCLWQKQVHIPSMKRDEAHMCPGAFMVAHHKTLT